MAAVVGLGLMIDSLRQSSATYDEVAYLRVAARWWRTGDQEAQPHDRGDHHGGQAPAGCCRTLD